MEYIVLEGVTLYIIVALIALLLLITFGSLICVVLLDKSKFTVTNLLLRENEKVKILLKENFVLRLRCREFNIDEK